MIKVNFKLKSHIAYMYYNKNYSVTSKKNNTNFSTSGNRT